MGQIDCIDIICALLDDFGVIRTDVPDVSCNACYYKCFNGIRLNYFNGVDHNCIYLYNSGLVLYVLIISDFDGSGYNFWGSNTVKYDFNIADPGFNVSFYKFLDLSGVFVSL